MIHHTKVLQMIRFGDISLFICDFNKNTMEISMIESNMPNTVMKYKVTIKGGMVYTPAYTFSDAHLIYFIHNNDLI